MCFWCSDFTLWFLDYANNKENWKQNKKDKEGLIEISIFFKIPHLEKKHLCETKGRKERRKKERKTEKEKKGRETKKDM